MSQIQLSDKQRDYLNLVKDKLNLKSDYDINIYLLIKDILRRNHYSDSTDGNFNELVFLNVRVKRRFLELKKMGKL
jgi:hypothetical protein